jgi:hypothetical protein
MVKLTSISRDYIDQTVPPASLIKGDLCDKTIIKRYRTYFYAFYYSSPGVAIHVCLGNRMLLFTYVNTKKTFLLKGTPLRSEGLKKPIKFEFLT